ncbi:MAG: phosphoribosylglycinamide formyltransferase [Bdellovibrionales bacterium]|nr:phosphoribosylglycinamide formyltransferase [Bdellovibrionales bacterium]
MKKVINEPKPANNKKKRLVILASGTGTLFLSIVKSCKTGHLKAEVIHLISDHNQAPVLEKAKKENISVKILNPKKFSSFSDWDKALCRYLKSQKPDLILLAGFIKKIGPGVLSFFKNRILNIHPSLLPRHGGYGMYGVHVHRSVLEVGDKKTGISIHLVSEEYDAGPILAQIEIPVSPKDTPESLQKKVKQIEPTFYISTLRKILTGEIPLRKDTNPEEHNI